MCKFCEQSEDIGVSLNMIISDNKLIITHSHDEGPYQEDVEINYCPKCGKDLRPKPEQVKDTRSKHQIWQEDYNHVTWEEFKEDFWLCVTCRTYVDEVCMCYVR